MFTTDGGRCRVARIETVVATWRRIVCVPLIKFNTRFTGVLSGKSNWIDDLLMVDLVLVLIYTMCVNIVSMESTEMNSLAACDKSPQRYHAIYSDRNFLLFK